MRSAMQEADRRDAMLIMPVYAQRVRFVER